MSNWRNIQMTQWRAFMSVSNHDRGICHLSSGHADHRRMSFDCMLWICVAAIELKWSFFFFLLLWDFIFFAWLFSVKSSLYLQHVSLRGLEPTLRAMQSFQQSAETPETIQKSSLFLAPTSPSFYNLLPNSIHTDNLYMNESHIRYQSNWNNPETSYQRVAYQKSLNGWLIAPTL